MSATVPNVVSNQSSLSQTASKTLSYTPTVSGLFRLNAYAVVSFVGGDTFSIKFGWTDGHTTYSWAPNDGPTPVGFFTEPKSILIKATSGNAISFIYTVTAGAPSADLYLVIEDMN